MNRHQTARQVRRHPLAFAVGARLRQLHEDGRAKQLADGVPWWRLRYTSYLIEPPERKVQ